MFHDSAGSLTSHDGSTRYLVFVSEGAGIELRGLALNNLTGEGQHISSDRRRAPANTIFGIALTAGMGLFLIRLSSNDAWGAGRALSWPVPRTG